MIATQKSPVAALLVSCGIMMLSTCAALSQSSQIFDPGVVPDDMLTLVVGTRFIAPSTEQTSPPALFKNARIPLSAFNETDHCIDQQALELAKEYFTTLGRVMGKAGHFYLLPEDDIRKAVAMCERLHRGPPKAWVDKTTRIIAFGQVVPTTDAPPLEKSIR